MKEVEKLDAIFDKMLKLRMQIAKTPVLIIFAIINSVVTTVLITPRLIVSNTMKPLRSSWCR